MRCYCCDKELSDYESTLRSITSKQYLDMCMDCIRESDIVAVSLTSSVPNTHIEQEIIELDD